MWSSRLKMKIILTLLFTLLPIITFAEDWVSLLQLEACSEIGKFNMKTEEFNCIAPVDVEYFIDKNSIKTHETPFKVAKTKKVYSFSQSIPFSQTIYRYVIDNKYYNCKTYKSSLINRKYYSANNILVNETKDKYKKWSEEKAKIIYYICGKPPREKFFKD